MALKKKPVTGMKDILPKEMEVRNYVTGLIRETYGSFGFTSIETREWSTLRTCAANRAVIMRS